uniref:Uncharacterized protein n=1 Tax=viral metagenome TaxID=1070528 RepID=A0A6C0BQU2_9ZZZZ
MKRKLQRNETYKHSQRYKVKEQHKETEKKVDGSVRTVEHWTSRQKEDIREARLEQIISQEKSVLLERKNREIQEHLDRWREKRYGRCKYLMDRVRQFQKQVDQDLGDLPDMKSKTSLADVIAEQKRYIQYSTDDMRQNMEWNVGTGVLEQIQTNKVVLRDFTEAQRETRFGSYYMLTALSAVLMKKAKQDIVKRIKKRLQEDEKKRKVHIETVAPGVIRRITPAQYPFTQDEEKELDWCDSSWVNHYGAQEIYEDYIRLAVASDGKDPTLMQPILEQIITTQILLKFRAPHHNPLSHLPLPELLLITDVKLRKYDSFPFAPIDFWGHPKKADEYFACCQFLIQDEPPVIYEDIWIEMPLLVNAGPTYRNIAEAAFMNFVRKFWQNEVDEADSVDMLINLDPFSAQMKRLNRKVYGRPRKRLTQQEQREVQAGAYDNFMSTAGY